MNSLQHKMKVEIWSDVMCPFCYIGKRKFEAALAEFRGRDNIQLVWKSFQLAPDIKTITDKNIHQYLAEHKGFSLDEAKRLNDHVTQMAANIGLTYNFDKLIVANSFNAHRFSHFANQKGKQNEAEEKLFRAYFTDGKNIDDINTLVELGIEIGIDASELKSALENGMFASEVKADIDEARELNIRGVPFFVFNRKYAVSGAQESEAFLQVLNTSFMECTKENPVKDIEVSNGQANAINKV